MTDQNEVGVLEGVSINWDRAAVDYDALVKATLAGQPKTVEPRIEAPKPQGGPSVIPLF